MSTDLDAIASRATARRIHPSHECPDRPVVEADLEALIDELRQARAEVTRLTTADADLRASAEIWCRLYEASRERADAAAAEVARMRTESPDTVKSLYLVLDRVAAATEALSALVRECASCAKKAGDSATIEKATGEACARCAQALDALSIRLS